MRTLTVDSLTQLYDELSKFDANGYWLYRGQADASWGLIPSVYRGVERLNPVYEVDDAEWIARLERDVYREFEMHARAYQATNTPWEQLALAQHHGTPTRLLDWTRSTSIGLYFALATVKLTAPALWCFNSKDYPFPDFLGRTKRTFPT